MRKVVVLSTADFASPVWTNKQHIAVGLAEDYDVHYIESLGLRRPSFNRADSVRILRRALRRSSTGNPDGTAHGPLKIHSPRVLPFHGLRPIRWYNHKVLCRLIRQIGVDENDVLWSFSPVAYGIAKRFGFVVYHSVDLLHKIPGIPAEVVLQSEQSLIADSDVVIASSKGVAQHLARQAPYADIILWENVANTELFATCMTESRIRRAIFAGHLTPTKLDTEILSSLLDDGIPLALAGPIAIDGSKLTDGLRAVLRHPGTTYLGNLEPLKLAEEVGRSMVGIIPYVQNEYTAGVFPMKVFEYLGAGLSVIATPLESLSGTKHVGVTVTNPEDFALEARKALTHFSTESAKTRADYAREFSWSNRLQAARDLIDNLGSHSPQGNASR